MPISIPTLTQGTLTASGVNSIFQQLEDFINGGIDKTDIDTSSKWCTERHIVRPVFFGSPAPKTLLCSSDVHTRYVGNDLYKFVITNDISQDYVPIPGLSATIYADLNQDENSSCLAIVHACWHCLEKEANFADSNAGFDDATSLTGAAGLTQLQVETDTVARFALFVNGIEVEGTERRLFVNYEGFAFKNHSISAIIGLNRGMNNVSVRVKPAADISIEKYQIFIKERNINIEVIYR